jgi:hypothetical protein
MRLLSNNHLLMDRTRIPAELKRRVLVEAGHRCAIHTCKHPAVDVHHIIPWSQSQEHSYENLIALCPNCHRRADSGEIDRQSLLAYKARVRARFDLPNERDESDQQNAETHGWIVRNIRESSGNCLSYGLQVEYPEFMVSGEKVEGVNSAVAALAFDEVQKFRSYTLLAAPHLFRPDCYPSVPANLGGSFAVSLFVRGGISVRFSFGSYAWGAHSNHVTRSLNFMLNPVCKLSIHDLLPRLDGLKALSHYCTNKLLEAGRAEHAVKFGANENFENFSCFNLSPFGILINFLDYQVGCYAEGPIEVLWPAREAAAHLIPQVRDLFTGRAV